MHPGISRENIWRYKLRKVSGRRSIGNSRERGNSSRNSGLFAWSRNERSCTLVVCIGTGVAFWYPRSSNFPCGACFPRQSNELVNTGRVSAFVLQCFSLQRLIGRMQIDTLDEESNFQSCYVDLRKHRLRSTKSLRCTLSLSVVHTNGICLELIVGMVCSGW